MTLGGLGDMTTGDTKGPLKTMLIAGCVLTGFMVGVAAWMLDQLWLDAWQQATQTSRNLALSLERDVARTIETYDFSLRAAVRDVSLPGLDALRPELQEAILFNDSALTNPSQPLLIVDAAGLITHSNVGPARALNGAETEAFIAHRDSPGLGLLVGRPVRIGGSDSSALTLSRRIEGADGSFAGVVIAMMDMRFLRTLFDGLHLGGQDVVALTSADGSLVMRRPFDVADIGRDVRGYGMFQQSLRAPAGTQTATGKLDGARRLYAFRRIAGLPLTVFVGLSAKQINAALIGKMWALGGMAAAFLVLLLLLGGVLVRELRRRSVAEAAIRLAQESARASDAKFRVYFDKLADGLLVIRAETDGSFVYAEMNHAAETMLGRAARDVIGRKPGEVWPPGQARIAQQELARCAEYGAPTAYTEHRDLPEDRRELRVNLAPVRDGEGRVTLIVKSVRDTTDVARLEEGLRRSQRMEAIGQLASGIAHDFNNLLQAQMGSLELLLREVRGDIAAERHARTALEMGERGAKLTHRLLAYSRKQLLLPRHVELFGLLAGMEEMLRRTLGPQITVRTVLAADLPAAYVDPAQLENALLNLALNARDAMPHGGLLRLEAFPAGGSGRPPELLHGDYVVVAAADAGYGMTDEVLTRACEPFFTTKGSRGSGLGLSMVSGFARQSGGDLVIRSGPEQGTRVEIWLPCAGPVARVDDVDVVQGSAERVDRPCRRRLLVIDDDTDVLVTIEAFLESAGFEVVACSSAASALVELQSDRVVDVLVTDYGMPALNGAELIEKATALRPGLACLLITGYVEALVVKRTRPVVPVLHKPFRSEDLITAVRDLLEAVPADRSDSG